MKEYIVIILFAAVFTGCNKHLSKTGLVGKWNLTESLMDPGDGSGKWTPPSQKTTIEFTSAGLIKYDDNKPSVAYKIINDSLMEISSPGSSTISYRYKVDDNKLFMRPPCIEACGERYIRLR